MPITRRNLLHGIAAAGTSVSAPTLLNRNENAYGPSQKVLAVLR